jgi:hypothetical protein
MTAAVIALLMLSAGPASAQAQIGPDQHFVGLVNGSRARPIVLTVCPGPARGRMGSVVGGQTLQVAEVGHAHGYTGPMSQIYAWFVPRASPAAAPTMLTFATYGTPQEIPSTVHVPCGGRGKVEFSSCPYLAPCVFGWTPSFVRVRFGNIAL